MIVSSSPNVAIPSASHCPGPVPTVRHRSAGPVPTRTRSPGGPTVRRFQARDGTSRFTEENRWSNFPAAALAWKLDEESLFKNIKSLSNLKLRLGWGITGQQDIVTYPSIPLYLGADTGAQYLLYDFAVAAGESKTTARFTMKATDVLRVYSDTGAVAFNVNGIEEDA